MNDNFFVRSWWDFGINLLLYFSVKLTDVSSIQQILPSHKCQAEKQKPLSVEQLMRLLKELFKRTRLEKPGQVDPKAAELTLRLLTSAYDR